MSLHSTPTRLGEILKKSEDWIEIEPQAKYKQVTVKLWGQGVELRQEVYGTEISASRQLRVHRDQFILSRIDARNGAFGLVPQELEGAIVSNDFPTFNVNTDQLFPKYLGWLSKTSNFVELCKAASEGTTNRVRLKEDRFLALEIPLPLLEEQRRIVAHIEVICTKLEEAHRIRKSALENVDLFITNLHVDYAENRVVKLGDILQIDEDKEEIDPTQSYPQVGVKGFGGGLFEKESVSGLETTYKSFNRLYSGALVLSQVKGWEGAVAVCPDQLDSKFVSPEYRTFRCIPGQAEPKYLSELVATPWFWQQLKDLTKGMGGRRERVRPELFLDMEILMPTIQKQEKAVSILKKLQPTRMPRLEAIEEQADLLPSILDKAFKGKL